MIVRLFAGAGLFVLGYLVGREVGRSESVRDQLRWAAGDDRVIDVQDHEDSSPSPEEPLRS
jgi:hypothetical protein